MGAVRHVLLRLCARVRLTQNDVGRCRRLSRVRSVPITPSQTDRIRQLRVATWVSGTVCDASTKRELTSLSLCVYVCLSLVVLVALQSSISAYVTIHLRFLINFLPVHRSIT